VQAKEADLVKDALGRTPTLGYKEGDFDMGINEGPSGFHSVYDYIDLKIYVYPGIEQFRNEMWLFFALAAGLFSVLTRSTLK